MSMEQQTRLLLEILQNNKDSDYGRRYHFENILTEDGFRGHVPVSCYDNYAPMIELSTRIGESNIFTSKPLACYTVATGSFGVQRRIPCTEEYAKICFDSLKELFCTRGKSVVLFQSFPRVRPFKDGKYLNSIYGEMLNVWKKWKKGNLGARFFSLGSCTSPEELLFASELYEQTYLRLLFSLQFEDVTQIVAPNTWNVLDFFMTLEKDWQQLVKDVENGTLSENVLLSEASRAVLTARLKKLPKRAAQLRAIFEQGFDEPVLRKIWPQFTKIIADGSAGFSNYTDKLKKYIGDAPIDYGCSITAEAMILKNIPGSDEYHLLPEIGYFEFIPVGADSGSSVTMDALTPDESYEVLLTSRFGFYRYKLDTVVKLLRYDGDVPVLKKGYRINQTASLAGEAMNEQQVAEAVRKLEAHFSLSVYDYCYHPEEDEGCYTVLLETEAAEGIAISDLERVLEQELRRVNPAYAAAIDARRLRPCRIRFLAEQTQLLYRDIRCMREQLPVETLLPVRYIDTPVKEKFFFGLAQ